MSRTRRPAEEAEERQRSALEPTELPLRSPPSPFETTEIDPTVAATRKLPRDRPASVLALQRHAGNTAVGRMVAQSQASPARPMLQRQDGDAGVSLPGGVAGTVTPQEAEHSEYLGSKSDREKFDKNNHETKDFQSTTGIGLFDAEYRPNESVIEISIRCKFTMVDGQASDWPKAKKEDLKWTDADAKKWKENFSKIVGEKWSGKHTFHCQRDWWEGLSAKVSVKFVEVSSDQHFKVSVMKIPPGEFRGSSVTSPMFGRTFGGGSADFDSEDLTSVGKPGGSQRAAVHEAGHMLGLDDEYVHEGWATSLLKGDIDHSKLVENEFGKGVARKDDGRIMSGGEDVQPEHGVTFLEALKKATGMSEWSHTPKKPRQIPSAAMGDLGPSPGDVPHHQPSRVPA